MGDPLDLPSTHLPVKLPVGLTHELGEVVVAWGAKHVRLWGYIYFKNLRDSERCLVFGYRPLGLFAPWFGSAHPPRGGHC